MLRPEVILNSYSALLHDKNQIDKNKTPNSGTKINNCLLFNKYSPGHSSENLSAKADHSPTKRARLSKVTKINDFENLDNSQIRKCQF